MITPDYLNEVIKATEDVSASVDEQLLRVIVNRIVKTFENDEGELFTTTTKAQMRLLKNGGMLYEEIQQEIEKRLPSIRGAVRQAFLESADEINKQNLDIARQIVEIEDLDIDVPKYIDTGLPHSIADLNMTVAEIRTLENMFNRTNSTIKNMTQTTASMAQSTYINACDNAYAKVQRGMSINSAVIDAIKEASDKGVTVVDYATGRETSIEAAISRAVRTGVNQANGEIVLTRCSEMGVNTVKVSEHLGARVTKVNDYTNHSWWQGKVYSIDWNDTQLLVRLFGTSNRDSFDWLDKMKEELAKKNQKQYPDLVKVTGYGNVAGLCGANCRHTFYPFYPGINIDRGQEIDQKENERIYNLTQKQRAMERQIRKTKRNLVGLSASGKSAEEFKAEKKAIKQRLMQQSDKYMQFCKDNKLKPRDMALRV